MLQKCHCNGSRGTDCDYCGGTGIKNARIMLSEPSNSINNYKSLFSRKKVEIQKRANANNQQNNMDMNDNHIQILIAKRVREKIQEYYQRPNQIYKNAAITLNGLLNSIANNKKQLGPIEFGKIGLNKTNHGESRIHNCVKYHMGFQSPNGVIHFRVVTVELKLINSIVVIFFGDHDETEEWINKNKGYKIVVKEIGKGLYFEEVLMSSTEPLALEKAPIQGKLYSFIEKLWENNIKSKLNDKECQRWENLQSDVEDDYLLLLKESLFIDDEEFKTMLYDTFVILRSGEINKAISRVRLYFSDNVREPSEDHINQTIRKNDSFINLRMLSSDELNQFMNLDYDDIIIYLHPDQEKYSKEDYNGTVRISGVSGSGKTSILLNRAVNLAFKYLEDDKPILVITLQTSLTDLLERGINRIIETRYGKNKPLKDKIKNKLKIKSLWQLMSELIKDYGKLAHNSERYGLERRLNEVIHQGKFALGKPESIEEMWNIFYKYPIINYETTPENDCLFKIHQYLLDKGINPIKYIKDEFDYIRSFLSHQEFDEYINIERKNRLIRIEKGGENQKNDANRFAILEGLRKWQEFMRNDGISDYPELSIILYDLISRRNNVTIQPCYRSILVDESQDLGTKEMSIIRSLVAQQENDLFIVGDFAQKIHVKKMNFSDANVKVINHLKLTQNYRNSAEILVAADKVLKHNWIKTNETASTNEDIFIEDAEFSNFHSGKINLIKSKDFIDEITNAITFIEHESVLNPKIKFCLVVCGFSKIDIQSLKDHNQSLNSYVVLNTIIDYQTSNNNINKFNDGRFFISDLDHCKGFEFDTVIIINANNNIIPSNKISNSLLNDDYSNNEISKFYVAMTRAKTNLIVSYSDVLTEFLNMPDLEKYFILNETWYNSSKNRISIKIEEKRQTKNEIWSYRGKEFLFTDYAIGLSKEGQDKLLKVVTGKSLDERIGGKTIKKEFVNIKALDAYLKNPFYQIASKKLFGNSLEEIKIFLSKIE